MKQIYDRLERPFLDLVESLEELAESTDEGDTGVLLATLSDVAEVINNSDAVQSDAAETVRDAIQGILAAVGSVIETPTE